MNSSGKYPGIHKAKWVENQWQKGSGKYAMKLYSNSITTDRAFVDLRSPINVLYHITRKLKCKDPVQTPCAHVGIY